jgi:hypothetical protein
VGNGEMSSVSFVLALTIVGLAVVAGVWDVVALYVGQPGSTISNVIVDWSRRVPLLPFVTGVIVGHLFFPMRIR